MLFRSVWAGLNGVSFDDSPTGLKNGKFEKEVDFSACIEDPLYTELACQNMHYIDRLCGGD